MIAPKWWMGNKKQTKAMLVEEAFHLITQFGLSKAYPKKFGVENWESTIAKETKLAACKWWQHPENSCKKKIKVVASIQIVMSQNFFNKLLY